MTQSTGGHQLERLMHRGRLSAGKLTVCTHQYALLLDSTH